MLLSVGLRRLPLVPRDGARVVRGRGDRGAVNAHLVAVKVDREERPDVDAVYMTATQAMTGQGGWPMTVFMTPDGEPFFCGTYFPAGPLPAAGPDGRAGLAHQRDGVDRQARQVAAALAENAGRPPARWRWPGERPDRAAETVPVPRGRGAAAARRWTGDYDAGRRRIRRRAEVPAVDGPGVPAPPPSSEPGTWPALAMAEATCEAMARGGMYDQLGGGFARYSVDAGGPCRTSRRCSTTTRCSPVSTLTCGGGRAGPSSPAGSPRRPATSC